jgi:AcrR family transcriptional regulator
MGDVKRTGTGLPASIEAAWGLREPRRKGPKPGLSLERIVAAAIDVARSEGLDAVSMSRVAAELGSSPMSLYRYVDAKDELLTLMVDAALGPPAAGDPDEGWRAGLTRFSWGFLRAMRHNPWTLRVPISGPPATPNQMAWLEDGLASLRTTGLAESEKLSVILLLSGYVRNAATLATDLEAAASAAPGEEFMPAWSALIRRLTDAEGFPALHAALGSEAFDHDDDPDDEFAFGLERVLDGIEALVARRTQG